MSLGLSPEYEVVAELKAPDFATERAFLITERRYVAAQLKSVPKRGSWRWLWQRLDRAPGAADWRHYDEALERYGHKLDKAEQELAHGVLPVLLWVRHGGARPDRQIRVSVTVTDGQVHRRKRGLERPKPLDGAKPMEWSGLANVAQGFWRSHIRISPHHLQARLSRLGAGERAAVTPEVVYIETTPATHLTWKVASRLSPDVQQGRINLAK